MAWFKACAVAFSLICLYIAVSEANNVYYPAPQYGWAPWSKWCDCTKKCGGGDQWRTRKCLSPQITPYSPYTVYQCKGDAKETRKCNVYNCPVNGGYGQYGPYGKCSKSCGGGYQTCYRKCNNPTPQYGGKPCSGPTKKTQACNVNVKCPINGGYGQYGPYDKCSKTCGGGYQTCYRKCNSPAPQYGGRPCSGPTKKSRACNVDVKCPINGGYGQYGPYGKCSKPCGGGYQTCYRKCNSPAPQYGGKPCSGPSKKTQACNVHHCPVHGGYGQYGPYDKCSKSCGGGYQTCYRKCNNPAPQYGGRPCSGPTKRTKACNVHLCPVYIGFVKAVYRVNEDAGNVVIQVKRTGDLSKATTARIKKMPGGSASSQDHGNVDRDITFPSKASTVDVKISITDDKLVEQVEQFGVKLSSSDPAVKSVQPSQTRVIIIDNDAKIGFAKTGRSVPETIKSFKVKITRMGAKQLTHTVRVKSVDGTATSSSPDADYVKITPTTITFAPNDMEEEVTVEIIDDKLDEKTENFKLVLSTSDNRVVIAQGEYLVNIKDNDVDGNWGPWTKWSTCNRPCGTGSQSRSRKCDNPAPQGGGKSCQGKATETRKCYIKQYCPVNGGYGQYGPYDKCSKTCGGGYQTCYRKCNNPTPQYGGKPCSGPTKRTKACNVDVKCPINGGYGQYGPYDKCSKPCGGGYQTCYRKCNSPAPQYGGKPCSGPSKKTQACNVHNCPVHGGYGKYGPYDKCSKSCGGGYQTCYRKCNNPAPLYGGRPCSGPSKKTQACNVHRCPAKIGFKIASQTVDENAGTIKVEIIRTGGLAYTHKVSVKSVDGSAVGGSDFNKISPTTVVFGPNDVAKYIDVVIIDDSSDEQDEDFSLQLSTSDTQVTLTISKHTITIKDNDVDGKWGNWGPWTKCNKPCGTGSQSRSRKCDNPAPQGGGKPCQGKATETRKCYIKQYCPVPGGWSPWASYGKCSKPCGGGVCYRKRTCTKPAPQYGGAACVGPSRSSKTCNTKCCKVNGGYGAWSKWSPCSITCKPTPYAVGYQKRTRACNHPYPACNGAKCYGPDHEKKPCTPYSACPVYTPPPPAY